MSAYPETESNRALEAYALRSIAAASSCQWEAHAFPRWHTIDGYLIDHERVRAWVEVKGHSRHSTVQAYAMVQVAKLRQLDAYVELTPGAIGLVAFAFPDRIGLVRSDRATQLDGAYAKPWARSDRPEIPAELYAFLPTRALTWIPYVDNREGS